MSNETPNRSRRRVVDGTAPMLTAQQGNVFMNKTLGQIGAVLGALILATAGDAAFAGRPLQSEDAGVLGRGECEFEAAFRRESGVEAPSAREITGQVGCGVGVQTQLALALARSRSGATRGEGVALSGKTFLRELTETQAGLTLAYAIANARASGQSFRHESTEIKAVASAPLRGGDWLLHGNLGWSRAEGERQNSTLWSAAVERLGIGRFDLMAEVFGDDRSAPWWNTGLRYTAIEERLFIDASYGAQIARGRPKLVTVGLKYAF